MLRTHLHSVLQSISQNRRPCQPIRDSASQMLQSDLEWLTAIQKGSRHLGSSQRGLGLLTLWLWSTFLCREYDQCCALPQNQLFLPHSLSMQRGSSSDLWIEGHSGTLHNCHGAFDFTFFCKPRRCLTKKFANTSVSPLCAPYVQE